ncbi:MAG: hypothetical protein HQK84_12125, partial [Nitrospinae bacterium]|nr:hypothetical protein [Nitrospinota bacterium]
MTLKEHVIQGVVISPFLALGIGFDYACVFFLSFVFIDIDHYFLFIRKTSRFSVKEMFDFFDEVQRYDNTFISYCIFHSLETVLVLTLAGYFYSEIFWVILSGFIAHMLFDMFALYKE